MLCVLLEELTVRRYTSQSDFFEATVFSKYIFNMIKATSRSDILSKHMTWPMLHSPTACVDPTTKDLQLIERKIKPSHHFSQKRQNSVCAAIDNRMLMLNAKGELDNRGSLSSKI